jgi:hypothetical protein
MPPSTSRLTRVSGRWNGSASTRSTSSTPSFTASLASHAAAGVTTVADLDDVDYQTLSTTLRFGELRGSWPQAHP